MATSLCLLATQLGTSYNAISIRSRKDWDEYLQKCHGEVNSVPPSSVVFEEIIESPVNSRSLDSGKGQALPAIEGFTSLVLMMPAIVGPVSSSV